MNNRHMGKRLALSTIAAVLVATAPAQAQRPPLRIGVAIDGPWERNERVRTAFEREITQLLKGEYDVQFPSDKRLFADWTAGGVKANLNRLLDDPEVEAVITLGVLSSNDAGHRGPLPKPVLAPFIIEPGLQAVPFEIREQRISGQEARKRVRVSGVPNLMLCHPWRPDRR